MADKDKAIKNECGEKHESNGTIEIIELNHRSRSHQRHLRQTKKNVVVLANDTHITSTATEEQETSSESNQELEDVVRASPRSQPHHHVPIINSNLHVCGIGTGSESFCSGNILMSKMEATAHTQPPTLRAKYLDIDLAQTTRTITINLSESPTPSEMLRPPLMQRFMSIFSNTANVCLCSTFSRDCAILLLMYIGFTVLIFLLTVVSYNFLRVNIIGQHSTNTSEHYCSLHRRFHRH